MVKAWLGVREESAMVSAGIDSFIVLYYMDVVAVVAARTRAICFIVCL